MIKPTRAAALKQMGDFAPRMGKRYACARNYDRGPGQHSAVSGLSPHVRRRLVTEAELVQAALAHHGPEAAEKFVQEVVWRGYFKGWLERRPSIWASYRCGLSTDLAMAAGDCRLMRDITRAEEGRTGLECFDAWAKELVETGYLHNHARMWFASIWIFTLELPWRVGADFFYRHLVDGDPASNTLGWRWVGGLHTRGKAYQAQAWNIAKFTSQRFTPGAADLAAATTPLDHTEPEGLPPIAPVRGFDVPDPDAPTLLLLTEEDCRLEELVPPGMDIRGVAVLNASSLRPERGMSPLVERFEAGALADGAARLGLRAESLGARDAKRLIALAQDLGATQLATGFVPQGPVRDALDRVVPDLGSVGITFTEWLRDWDRLIWPHCTAGFFKVKHKIPRVIAELGLGRLSVKV